MKKRLLMLSLLGVMAFSITACGSNTDKETKEETVAEQSSVAGNESSTVESNSSAEENTEELAEENETATLSKAEQTAKDFTDVIQSGDYEKALSMFDGDTTFIRAEDLEWYIPRSDFNDIATSTKELSYSAEYGSNTEDVIKVSDGTTTVGVNVILNQDNEWKVVIPSDMCLNQVRVGFTGGCSDYALNGIAITDTYYKAHSNTLTGADDYVLVNVPKRNLVFTYTSERYGEQTIEKDITTVTEKDTDYGTMYSTGAFIMLDEETVNNYCDEIKVMCNAMMDSYYDNAPISDYVTDIYKTDAPTEIAENVGADVERYNNTKERTKFEIVQPYSIDECYISNNDVVTMALNIQRGNNARNTTRVYLYLGDETLKFYSADGTEKLFKCNFMDKDW